MAAEVLPPGNRRQPEARHGVVAGFEDGLVAVGNQGVWSDLVVGDGGQGCRVVENGTGRITRRTADINRLATHSTKRDETRPSSQCSLRPNGPRLEERWCG